MSVGNDEPSLIPRRQPGISSWGWGQLALKLRWGLPFVAVLAIALLALGPSDAPPSALGELSAGVAIAYFAFALAIGAMSWLKGLRERRAGYTTVPYGFLDLPQLHPKTGVVVRAAGAPQLTKEEWAAVRRRR